MHRNYTFSKPILIFRLVRLYKMNLKWQNKFYICICNTNKITQLKQYSQKLTKIQNYIFPLITALKIHPKI